MSIANPNWLTVVGLLYAAIGVALVATAVATTASSANLARSPRAPASVGIGGLGVFGGLLAGVGFFMQSLAQFHSVPQGGAVAFMLVALIALLGAYGIAALGSPASEAGDAADARAMASAPQQAEAGPAVAVVPATVKLVSAG